MEFLIKGTDRTTGIPVERTFEASDRQAAKLDASQSIIVTSVEPLRGPAPAVPAPAPAVGSIDVDEQARRAPNYSGLQFGASVLRVVAFLSYVGAVAVLMLGIAGDRQLIVLALGLFTSGAVTHTLGEAGLALRDIARNSFDR